MQQKWTKKEIDFAVSRRKEGWTILEIARELKRSVRAVEKQMYRQGVKLEPQPQTEQDFINAEKRKLSQKAKDKVYKELLREAAGTRLIIDKLSELVPKIKYESREVVVDKSKTKDEEVMVVELSDLHIGRITTNYNVAVFKERMGIMADRIVRMRDIFSQNRNIRELHIFGLGDWVDGDAIYPGQPFEIGGSKMKQIFLWGMPVIGDFLKSLSPFFSEIHVHCVKGNHGRNSKFDAQEVNWDLILYEFLKSATQNVNNVKWDITWEWYKIVQIFKWKFLLIHGDQVKMWMNLPFYGLTQKGMRWQGSIKDSWDYLVTGHFHTPINFVWNNFEVISNGTFLSGDDWAQRTLGMSSEETQIIFLVHPRKGVVNYNKIFFKR